MRGNRGPLPWPPFSPARWQDELAAWAEKDRSSWIWALDIDGTLVDLAPRPNDIVVPETLVKTLDRLSSLPGQTVALVSGRAISNILRHFPDLPPAIALFGSHGAEGRWHEKDLEDPRARTAFEVLDAVRPRLASWANAFPGTEIEDKGYTLSLHYRRATAKDAEELKTLVGHMMDDFPALEVLASKKCWDFRLRSGPTKADAVGRLLALSGAPARLLLFGDDRTDEDAFLAFPEAFSVRVGPLEPESTHARYTIPDPAHVRRLLAVLADRLAHRPA